MNWLILCRLLGSLAMLVGACMCFSLPWAFPIFGETHSFEYDGFRGLIGSIAVCGVLGGALMFIGRRETSGILRKEALAIVGLGWIVAGLLGALPYLLAGCERADGVSMTIADAIFESISGFSTTGASVLTQLEDPKMVPRCVLFWRSFTHWLGGMGIIVLFVAILGHLGAGGKALMRREVPGPISETVRPRVREAALAMWAIYVGISFVLTVVLCIEGLSVYDALCHSFGTMATGGFSTYNASVGHFQSVAIELTITFFMLLAGVNFSLYYLLFRPTPEANQRRTVIRRRLAVFGRDTEFRTYLVIIGAITAVLTMNLVRGGIYQLTNGEETGGWGSIGQSLRHALFVTVSIITTTGFGTEDFTKWGETSKAILLALMFVGGCAGSTGGGIKVIRYVLFFKILRLEIERAFRPNVMRPLRVNGQVIEDSHRHEIIVYFAIILFLFIACWLLLVAVEPDSQWTADGDSTAEKIVDCASAVASCLNNIGPGIGVLGPHDNYSEFSSAGKLILTALMLLGRLEIFAILVLLTPSFWGRR